MAGNVRGASGALPGIERGVVIIGGGPAGLAAAIAAREAGEESVLVLERDGRLGGILNQCVHGGFGLHTFREELTGPEYAARYVARADELGIERMLSTMAVDLSADRRVSAVSPERGVFQVRARAVVLAMGCRERPRGALAIPGFRPAGVYTAGTAQRLANVEGQLVGREAVILGSGDIGLIMARRMTLEGAHVACVAELMPYSGGLRRNIVQCLDDFDIPLLLSHTVTRVEGKRRVEAVWVAEVDGALRPVPGTEVRYPCDTLLLSVGLLPENELSRAAGVELSPVTRGPVVTESLETSVPGVFACGNVLHVHDLVDYVSEEAAAAGAAAARFAAAAGPDPAERPTVAPWAGLVPIVASDGVRYTVPSYVDPALVGDALTLRFRVDGVYRDRLVSVYVDGERVLRRRRRHLAPGEMEQVMIGRSELLGRSGRPGRVVIKIEEA